jgi:hypothetical protein
MICTLTADRLSLMKNGGCIGFLIEIVFVSDEGYFLRVEPFNINALRVLKSLPGDVSRKLTSSCGLFILPCVGATEHQMQAVSIYKINLIRRITENCGLPYV